MAMQAEAAPLLSSLNLSPIALFPPAMPYVAYSNASESIYLVHSGKCPSTSCDNVGTLHASLMLSHALREIPGIRYVVNSGTCGGYASRGCSIGGAVMPSYCLFHDRHVDIPGTRFREYGVGRRDVDDQGGIRKAMEDKFGLKVGGVGTGDSLSITPLERSIHDENGVTVKEMEFAALHVAATQAGVPIIGVKVVTDIIDGEKPSSEEFVENLGKCAVVIDKVTRDVVEVLRDKFKGEGEGKGEGQKMGRRVT